MKRLDRKSDCAINYSLEQVGDPWSLLIVRDIVYYGKTTFGEFLASDERIGTSVLTRRLVQLEHNGIITKHPGAADKRKDEYRLTNKGLDLIPILFDLAQWGATHDAATGANPAWTSRVRRERDALIDQTRQAVEAGQSVMDIV